MQGSKRVYVKTVLKRTGPRTFTGGDWTLTIDQHTSKMQKEQELQVIVVFGGSKQTTVRTIK